jgi:gamma-glutamyl:cysteine ligase YbdK (ATP-grasp superfamily)
MNPPPLGLFEGTGIEIEYMIVDRERLDVRPLADELLRAKCGRYRSELENGPIAWSGELALHLLELKTSAPAPRLAGLAARFQADVCEANERLAPLGARLLPGGMHPWMDPRRELHLWPHQHAGIYRAFDRIFGCRSHGWANLQSTQLNLPFRGDGEFARLHAALRLLLPLLPALAASSPLVEGAPSGFLDSRLEFYRTNARRVPSVTGAVVPEPVFSRAEYESAILGRIHADLAPLDPDGTLRHEWVNARGCIARFERSALEIRVLDTQECPRADLAVAAAVIAVTRALVLGQLSPEEAQRAVETDALAALLVEVAREGEAARLEDPAYLALFGSRLRRCRVGELWADLVERVVARDPAAQEQRADLEVILAEGPLARRLLRRLGVDPGPARLHSVYGELAECLAAGELFRAAGR